MKFAVIKDPHFRFGFTNSIRRNYDGDLVNKINQLIQILKDNNVEYLLIPGDIFDESYGNKWRFQAYQMNKEILKEISNAGIKILSIPGNHDYFDGYEDSSRKTIVGDKEASKYTKPITITQYTVYGKITSDDDNIIEDVAFKTGDKVNNYQIIERTLITGVRYRSDLSIVTEELNEIHKLINELKNNNSIDEAVVMLHQNVTPGEVKHITEFTYDQLANDYPNVDYFLLGHYHVGYEPTKVNNTWFINPYNFTRVNRNYEVRLNEHIPEVVIVSDKDNVENIKLKVKSFDEAFIPEYISFMKITNEELKKDSLDLSLDENLMKDDEIIAKVAQEHKFDTKVIDYVINKMNSVK